MARFDSYGGNFTPSGYMKVNAGGSHEENPNGGVQVGVDPQGTPNLLEEGEPVYNDYVYSDNIIASEEFLVKNNIPKKYAGRLYSEIADALFSEYEERELDPISKNGADAMLSRLASAQEEQKQYEQQKEIEDYINSLSPEDLQALEEQLAIAEQQEAQQAQMAPQPSEEEMMAMQQQPMPQEQMPMEQPMPMMARGGHLARCFAPGGPLGDELPPAQTLYMMPGGTSAYAAGQLPADAQLPLVFNPETGQASELDHYAGEVLDPAVVTAYPGKSQAWVDAQVHPFKKGVTEAINSFPTEAADFARSAPGAARMIPGAGQVLTGLDAVEDFRNGNYGWGAVNTAFTLLPMALRTPGIQQALSRWTANAGNWAGKAKSSLSAGKEKVSSLSKEITEQVAASKKAAEKMTEYTAKLATETDPVVKESVKKILETETKNFGEANAKAWQARWDILKNGTKNIGKRGWKAVADMNNWFANGLKVPTEVVAAADDVAANVGGQAVEETVKKGLPKWARWGIGLGAPTLAGILIDRSAKKKNARKPLPSTYVAPSQIDSTETMAPQVDSTTGLTKFGPYVPKTNFNVKARGGKINIFAGGSSLPRYDWEERLPALMVEDEGRKLPQINMPTGVTYDSGLTNSRDWFGSRVAKQDGLYPSGSPVYDGGLEYRRNPGTYGIDYRTRGWGTAQNAPYSTTGMYAPAFLGAAEGVWDAFQPIDKYRAVPVQSFEPEGDFSYERQYYTPEDRNEMLNAVLAQGNGLISRIGNSGAGPSTIAGMLAADSQIGQNAGRALWTGIQGNAQNKNAAIQANNQYGSIASQYGLMVDRYRQAERARAQQANAQMAIPLQQLNYGAEGDYYAALQNQAQAVAQALADIARMKFAYNQINSDTSNEGYGSGMNGWARYGNNANCGGKIKRKK